MIFFSLLRWISVESTLFRTLPSFSAAVTVPAPVTTTSPICSGFATKAKSWVIKPGRSMISADCAL